MKHKDQNNPKRKNFLRIPTYPGGKEAYLKFIKDNVVYPQEALSNKVEGLVYVKYTVNNIGEIVDIEVTKGIGYGCDEEAIRVIRLLTYEPARNRGVKMKAKMKTRIRFELPGKAKPQTGISLNYLSVPVTPKEKPEQPSQPSYNYTIKLD